MKKIDMTNGPIIHDVVRFALPIIAGNILQYLYTTVDTLVIGNYCDHTSLAAVGTSAQPVEALLCVFLGIGTGVCIRISQHVGANNRTAIKKTCNTSVGLVYLCGLPVSVLGWFAVPLLLNLMSVPGDVMPQALLYTRIVMIGAIGNIGYNMNAGILRGIGDSRASLYFLMISCITNVVMDIVLVAVFHQGVPGVAAATAMAMMLAWLFSIFYIHIRYPNLGVTALPESIDRKELSSVITIGLPVGLNNSLFSFGHMALQTLVNGQGSVFMAAWSVSGRVNGIANMAISGISSAATTFSGQNYGAGRIDRLRQGQIHIPMMSGTVTLAFGLLFTALRFPILRMFTTDPQILNHAAEIVRIMLLGQWMYAVFNGISCIVNGTGRVKYTTAINLLMLWAVRIPAAYMLSRAYGGMALPYSFPISFAFGMICMIGYYCFSADWKKLIHRGIATKNICSA